MAPMYYRRANAALIVYDITREKSFDEAKEWVRGEMHFIMYTLVLLYCVFRAGEQGRHVTRWANVLCVQ